ETAVVPLPGKSLGVLVRQRRSGGFHHRLGNEVLAGDQLQPVGLSLRLLPDERGDFRIDDGKRLLEPIHLASVARDGGSYHTLSGCRFDPSGDGSRKRRTAI